MTDYPTVTISPAVHRPSLSLPLPDRKLASKAPLCEGEETRSSITRSSSPGYEWANSDPPIQRPASFPHNKLFLPVAEETDAFRSYWGPSNYEAWRNRRMETRHRSMRSTSSTIKYNPWPYAVRRAERRAHSPTGVF
ncbi:hypothetical protein FOZ60_002302 [Perkinsus olseni]|uniref:Uncharacterized protein n=1 Tax=Perkinsus olseni TaxID=32597 RepID=A0A7J6PJB9_PEROL|nr:hypothetical protein FOZ60_002302 [Perkinsus olseni]